MVHGERNLKWPIKASEITFDSVTADLAELDERTSVQVFGVWVTSGQVNRSELRFHSPGTSVLDRDWRK